MKFSPMKFSTDALVRQVAKRFPQPPLHSVAVCEHLAAQKRGVGPHAGFERDEHRDRLAPVGDHDPLTLGDPFEQPGEVGLCLESPDGIHGCLPINLVY